VAVAQLMVESITIGRPLLWKKMPGKPVVKAYMGGHQGNALRPGSTEDPARGIDDEGGQIL